MKRIPEQWPIRAPVASSFRCAPNRQIADQRRRYPKPNFAANPIRWSFPVGPTGISFTIRIFFGTL